MTVFRYDRSNEIFYRIEQKIYMDWKSSRGVINYKNYFIRETGICEKSISILSTDVIDIIYLPEEEFLALSMRYL